MTAVVLDFPPLPPSPTRGMNRVIALDALRRTAELETTKQITETRANQRLARYASKTLTTEDRNALYEGLKDAVRRASDLTSDDFDITQVEPENRDLEQLLDNAEHDIEHHLQQLAGPCR